MALHIVGIMMGIKLQNKIGVDFTIARNSRLHAL